MTNSIIAIAIMVIVFGAAFLAVAYVKKDLEREGFLEYDEDLDDEGGFHE